MALATSIDMCTGKKCARAGVLGGSISTTVTEIDLSDDVPNNTKAVRFQIHYQNASGNFIGRIGPKSDKSIIDDQFYDYGIGTYHSDHVCSRLDDDRKCYVWSTSDSATVYFGLVEIYY